MEPQPYLARRAMIEDLDQLRALWHVEQLPELRLEKNFTDFQVVETSDGRIVAALGMQVEGRHGRIHSEAFEDFALTDRLRPMLWERLNKVAQNRGLARLWTQESAPFWREQGFEAAPVEVLETLPAAFDTGKPGWFTMKLKDEILAGLTADQEFALFRQAAREETEKLQRQARTMKMVAMAIAVLLFVLVIVTAVLFVKFDQARRSGRLPAPGQR